MPILSPKLYKEIVQQCEPYFRLPDEREPHLVIPLSGWEGYSRINWSGSAHSFTVHLVGLLPVDRLKEVLRALLVGYQDEPHIEELCQQIDADQGLLSVKPEAPFDSYRQALGREWAAPRYQYDSRFVQLTLLLDKGPDAQDGRFVPDTRHHRYHSLPELLDKVDDKVLVLLGNPGSGKTTLLRRLQWERAWKELEEASDQTTFLVPLSSYQAQPGQTLPAPQPWLASQWQLLQQQHPSLPDFSSMLQTGRLLLLLDGLNEMPHRDKKDYRQHIEQWRQFLSQVRYYGNTILFSCRSLDYSAPLSSEVVPVRQVRVEPLSPAQIESFLRVYLTDEDSERVWHRLRQSEQQLTLFANPFFLRLLVDEVMATQKIPEGQAALLTGFVRRALHREITERNSRLFAPDILLTEADYEQVLHGEWASDYDLPMEGDLIPHLEKLAFAMQDARHSGESGQVRVSQSAALKLVAHAKARDLIDAGIQLNVLDKDLARHELHFFHQLLQEYFAARVLAENPEPARVAVPWRADELTPSLAEEMARLAKSDPLPPPPATGWEETTLMAAAMNAEPDEFVRRLMPLNLVLAARCAAASEGGVSQSQGDAIRQALRQRLADPDTDLRVRIAMAEALGDLGDPRFARHNGPHGAYLLPPFVAIAGGAYPIGDDDSSYDGEKPAHEVVLHPLEMAIFPVTNAEYALFMAAGGYEDEQWWHTEVAKAWLRGESGSEDRKQNAREFQAYLQGFSDDTIRQQNASPDQIAYWLWLKHASSAEVAQEFEKWYPSGKKYKQPACWEDGRFNHRAQPVVGITWFEANAYCAWLSVQTGRTYTLPTEVEWEAAAGGRNGRVYAYGDTFAATWGNTFETHIRRPTPVGVFPQGGTPEGIFDLSGTVWEWTSTIWGKELQNPDFKYPYVGDDGRENQEDGTSRRVVRGGSWYNDQDRARVTYRSNDHPSVRDANLGFRVVCRPPSQDH